jgi:orotate phosphoribosyltransferase
MTSLCDHLKECGAIKFGDFTLASGKKSKYYIDIKKASANPRILKLMASEIAEKIKINSIDADYIGCVALGGVPIAVAVSLETDLPLIIIMVEDVATTGGSVLKAIKLLREEGLIITNVIVVVDREEGAHAALADEGVELTPLIRIGDLLKE